ncbi:hypothetical protein RCL_jg2999.t1 [Rhizophagus clarus]|uniref:Uncharacterized protein n=1 Tax=Rhizophagus clarus TaxID=94130 RepID=A0A8H3M983_9GLOM|nr:hypothetical protein RCL_jg2999.t1 [Rhizophagus clarus]
MCEKKENQLEPAVLAEFEEEEEEVCVGEGVEEGDEISGRLIGAERGALTGREGIKPGDRGLRGVCTGEAIGQEDANVAAESDKASASMSISEV